MRRSPIMEVDSCAEESRRFDDLTDFRLAPVEAGRVFDGVAEGEGIHLSLLACSRQVWDFVQIPEFDIIELAEIHRSEKTQRCILLYPQDWDPQNKTQDFLKHKYQHETLSQ